MSIPTLAATLNPTKPPTTNITPVTRALHLIATAHANGLIRRDTAGGVLDLTTSAAITHLSPVVTTAVTIAAAMRGLHVAPWGSRREYTGWIGQTRLTVQVMADWPAPPIPGHTCRGCGRPDCPNQAGCEADWAGSEAARMLTTTARYTCPTCALDVRHHTCTPPVVWS